MTEGWEEQMHAVDVITRVRERLEAEGADAELFRLRRFSSDELAILVRLELGMDPVRFMPARYKNAPLPIMENRKDNPKNDGKKKPAARAAKPRRRRSAPVVPQGRRGTVAA